MRKSVNGTSFGRCCKYFECGCRAIACVRLAFIDRFASVGVRKVVDGKKVGNGCGSGVDGRCGWRMGGWRGEWGGWKADGRRWGDKLKIIGGE